MSYILEALKKSEQERNPDRVPDLSTHHEQVTQAPKKSFPWLWLVIVLVVMNLFVMYWLFFQQSVNQIEQSSTTNQVTEQVVEQPVLSAEKPVVEKPVVQSPITTEASSSAKPSVVTKPATEQLADNVSETTDQVTQQAISKPIETPRVLGFNELPHISELSLSIQNQLPGLAFSTHIFVEGGGSFVILNNKNLSSGMTVSDGLVLERIVREGVILSYRSRYFTLNSMESWTK